VLRGVTRVGIPSSYGPLARRWYSEAWSVNRHRLELLACGLLEAWPAHDRTAERSASARPWFSWTHADSTASCSSRTRASQLGGRRAQPSACPRLEQDHGPPAAPACRSVRSAICFPLRVVSYRARRVVLSLVGASSAAVARRGRAGDIVHEKKTRPRGHADAEPRWNVVSSSGRVNPGRPVRRGSGDYRGMPGRLCRPRGAGPVAAERDAWPNITGCCPRTDSETYEAKPGTPISRSCK